MTNDGHGIQSSVFHRGREDDYPLFVRAKGSHFWEENGKEYVDFSSGMAWAASLGQGRDDIAEVLREQAGKLSYIHNAWASTDVQEEYATRLTALAAPEVNHAMFASGGSEINELALRIARQYHISRGDTSRWKFVSLEHSYHGATVGTLSMTGKVTVNEMVRTDYAPYLLDGFRKVPAPAQYKGPFANLSPEEAGAEAAKTLVQGIEEEGKESISAVILEIIMGNAGMITAPPGYLNEIREYCDANGILLIFDEIMTGAGRTGTFLCQEQYGVVPDMTTMAKSVSGGYFPLAAVLLHDRVADAIHQGNRRLDHVHTYSGHPVACAIGNKVLDILEQEDLINQAQKRGEFLRKTLRDNLGDLPCFGPVLGLGLANALHFVADRENREWYPEKSNVGVSVWQAMLERGFIIPGYRYMGSDLLTDHLLICPAFIITEEEISDMVTVLREVIVDLMPTW